MIFFHIILHPAVLVLVRWLSVKKGPFCALLSTSTKISTGVPWVMPDRFRRGTKKSGIQSGGKGWFCQSNTISRYASQKEKQTP